MALLTELSGGRSCLLLWLVVKSPRLAHVEISKTLSIRTPAPSVLRVDLCPHSGRLRPGRLAALADETAHRPCPGRGADLSCAQIRAGVSWADSQFEPLPDRRRAGR